MSEGKWTKGPWTLKDDTVVAVNTPDDGGDIICVSPDGFEDSMSRWRANARLIAAAPDLLEACESALIQIRALDPKMKKDMATPAVIEGLVEAIIKAKGETT